MFRLFALATLCVCPPAYLAMKAAAEVRHEIWHAAVEGGKGDLKGTWHRDALDWVYPV